MCGVGNRSAKEGIALGRSVFKVRPGSRTVCLSMGRFVTGRHRNARGSGREDRVDNSAHGVNHRGNNNNTHHNSVGSPMLINNKHMFKPGPESCCFGLGGGIGALTHGSTLSCGTRGGTVIVIRSFIFRTPGAGSFVTLAGGLGISSGGLLVVLPRTGGGMCLSTHGIRGTGIRAISKLGACEMLGTKIIMLARGSLGTVSGVLVWGKNLGGKGCCWAINSEGGSYGG